MGKIYGLVGKSLSHSFSPEYFSGKFARLGIDAEYRLIEVVQVDDILQIINDLPELSGFNVTIPFKRDILDLLTHADPVVRELGAANTVRIVRTGSDFLLEGFNTDVTGFERSLVPFIAGRDVHHALVLGSGGSAAAVAYVLRKLHIDHLLVSRMPAGKSEISYEALHQDLLRTCKLIINTTPLGMFPEISACPEIPYQYLTPGHLLYDLVYNPPETLFLQKGKLQGASVKPGTEMLRIQAEESWKIWKSIG